MRVSNGIRMQAELKKPKMVKIATKQPKTVELAKEKFFISKINIKNAESIQSSS